MYVFFSFYNVPFYPCYHIIQRTEQKLYHSAQCLVDFVSELISAEKGSNAPVGAKEL